MINKAGQTRADAQGQLVSWPPGEPDSLSLGKEQRRKQESEKKGEICWGRAEERSRRGVQGGIDNKWLSVCSESTDEVI